MTDPAAPIVPVPTAVVISNPAPRIAVGETLSVSAQVVDQHGTPVSTRNVTWTSENVSIARIDQAGVITGVGTGSTGIVATSAELVGTVPVTVTVQRVASVRLWTPKHTITWDATTRVIADVRDRGGNLMPREATSWHSSWPEVISVDQDGIVTAHATGSAWITGIAQGVSDSLPIVSMVPGPATIEFLPGWARVLPVGEQAFPGSVVRNAAGDVLSNIRTRFSSSDSSIMDVDGHILNARGVGVARITRSEGSLSTAIEVNVVDGHRAEALELTASAGEVIVGTPVVILMEARDGAGRVLTDRAKDDIIQDWGFGVPVHLRWAGDTAVFVSGIPGTYNVWRQVESLRTGVTIVVRPDPGAAGICQLVAGATLLGDDGQYLGHLVAASDPRSILNRLERYGSYFSSTSAFAYWSPYGMLASPLSALNPWANRPPRIVRDGVELGRLTINRDFHDAISPGTVSACPFP